jgi:hypothetical protein
MQAEAARRQAKLDPTKAAKVNVYIKQNLQGEAAIAEIARG